MLSIKKLCFNFKANKILDNLSLTLNKGETVALIGASGSGKTTLLRLISGMLSPLSGTIEKPPSVAYMSQQDLLLPWRNVENNVRLPLELERLPANIGDIDELLCRLEMAEQRHSYPHELSGGQYKRAMLARTLAPKRALLLLDEPFSSLDLPLRDKLYTRLRELNEATTLLVTHDFRDALSLANRIALINAGHIVQEWHIDPSKRDDPAFIGTLFFDFKKALDSPKILKTSINDDI